MNTNTIKERFPLHYYACINSPQELLEAVNSNEIDKHDDWGNTPLQLCAILGHTEAAEVLLTHGANTDLETEEGWSIVQESISSGSIELADKTLEARNRVRATQSAEKVAGLLQTLSNAPDFYCEMKWDISSWVPLVSRMCPSDTYKIYKSGPAVRVDSTLVGFDQNTWKRGNVSFLFKANESGCEVYEINHEDGTISLHCVDVTHPETDSFGLDSLSSRLSSALTTTRIKTDEVEFWREKAGLIGFRTDRVENVSGYDCAVYSTSGIEVISRARVEHLTEDQRLELAEKTSILESLVSGAAVPTPPTENLEDEVTLTREDQIANYFNRGYIEPLRRRQKLQSDRCQKFKARVWLTENHPLSLQEQLLPIVELMSTNNTHFSKLRDFITLQLPAGFPVNIEIPLYHMINARVTFSNINSASSPVEGVMCLEGAGDRDPTTCVVDAHIFTPPSHYIRTGGERTGREHRMFQSEEEMVQMALQNSLMNGTAGTGENDEEVTWAEALSDMRPAAREETEIERAVRLSLEEEQRRLERLREEEDAELERIIALSLSEQ